MLAAMTAGLALAGCNTIAGMGADVRSIGETVSDAAD